MFESALGLDLALIHHDYMVGLMDKINGMGDKDSGFVLDYAVENIVDYVSAHLSIKSGNRVVHEIDFAFLVDCSG